MKRDTIILITITTYIIATLAMLFGVVGYVEAKDNRLREDDVDLFITGTGVGDIDLRKPLGLRQLQEINRQAYENRYNMGFSLEYIQFLEDNENSFYSGQPSLESQIVNNAPAISGQALQGKPFGSSGYDDFRDLSRQGLEGGMHIGDIRANNQPWWAKLLAGIAKSSVVAGTTIANAVGGRTIGLIELPIYAIQGADVATVVSRLWDNEFAHATKDVQDWAEEAMPNYYTQAELNEPWYKHINASFIGDKVIENCLPLLMLAMGIPLLIILRKRKVRSEET